MVALRAWAVHILTACGAALALMALIFATGGQWEAMFFCLGFALIVDGVDGPLAREYKVTDVLPRWSGETLDLVVDFVTYVFVPAFAIVASGLMPEYLTIPAGVIVVISGAIYFADREMKTDSNYFRGFPAVWNLVAFYLYMLQPPEWLGFAGIVALAVLSFAPVKFLHPLRVRHWRWLNVVLLALWAVLAFIALISGMLPGSWVTVPLCVIAVYFFFAGFFVRLA
ncbi:MAG TPA: CDP-alcohol phosphatidyltransferase family protein [Pseudolabrys sp.]|nr:CDP-alcohol phosphatidyltransferase family protein [Pseudolabrys sp.]